MSCCNNNSCARCKQEDYEDAHRFEIKQEKDNKLKELEESLRVMKSIYKQLTGKEYVEGETK